MFSLSIKSKVHSYQAFEDSKLLNLLKNHLESSKKYFVFYDSKINSKIIDSIVSISPDSVTYELIGGEESKSFETYQKVLNFLLEKEASKSDELIVIGGGTLTDLIGYVAATYKRGISYISIPSTTLCMIDACIGGKTAINQNGIKNCIGTIYPPSKVLIGLDVLETLDERNFNNGLFEAIKIGLISNRNIFDIFVKGNYKTQLEQIIQLCLEAKKKYIEKDEFDEGERKILNFGHTIGHSIELNSDLLHGEAIANGMLLMSKNASFYNDLLKVINNLNCPVIDSFDLNLIAQDKKVVGSYIDVVRLKEIEKPYLDRISLKDFMEEF